MPAISGPRSDQNHRYVALDGYRAIAACLVVLYHYNKDFQIGLEHVVPAVERLNLLVDFFFVLSGFVVMTTYGRRLSGVGDYKTFLWRRIARLYPLHALTLCASLLLGAAAATGLVPANHPECFKMVSLPANLFLVHAWGFLGHDSFNVPSWSISAEWFVYLICPVLALSVRRLNVLLNLVLMAAAMALFVAWREGAAMRPWSDATFDGGALRAAFGFFAGMLIADQVARIPSGGWTSGWLLVHTLFLLGLGLMQVGAPDGVVIVVMASVVAAAALAERSGHATWLASPLAQRAGAASYSIYMIHVLASIPVLFVLRKAGLVSTPASGLAALVTFGAVLIVADFLYRRFELPCRTILMSAGGPIRPKRAQDRERALHSPPRSAFRTA